MQIQENIKKELNEIIEELMSNLDITESQYKTAVRSYQAVGDYLASEQSALYPYNPEILPQGSFLLGTMIKPIQRDDELDVDLVCRLEGKNHDWSQFDLKKIVGARLKESLTYGKMLDKEKRRCWTLNYAESTLYHMDILPAIVSVGYKNILEKAYSSRDYQEFENMAIRITDNHLIPEYSTETNPDLWPKSNPFGYAIWFKNRSDTGIRKAILLSESVTPLPDFQKNKVPLQRVVQILKRHRDLYYHGDDDKPISIIITTLAAYAYKGENDITTAFLNVATSMDSYIEERYSEEHGRYIKWIGNPVNDEENFADKWPETPRKEKIFFEWINKLKKDLPQEFQSSRREILAESMSPIFGSDLIFKALKNPITSGASTLSAETGKDINTELPKKLPKPKREGFQK